MRVCKRASCHDLLPHSPSVFISSLLPPSLRAIFSAPSCHFNSTHQMSPDSAPISICAPVLYPQPPELSSHLTHLPHHPRHLLIPDIFSSSLLDRSLMFVLIGLVFSWCPCHQLIIIISAWKPLVHHPVFGSVWDISVCAVVTPLCVVLLGSRQKDNVASPAVVLSWLKS